jgi:hypothetical protein
MRGLVPRLRRIIANTAAFCAYVLVALVFHWPLPARLSTALTGPVSGDTGVYVWNLWVFRHEIVAHKRFPLFTNEILSLTPPIDLSLHNYTLFADSLAFPLLPRLGVTTTFNVIYLAMAALTAWTMFLLARRVVGRTAEAWLAGLLFGFSPILLARSTAHFSLVAAAPLPVFVLCLMRLERRPTTVNAAAAGAVMAWAATCDAYFGVYCLLIAACYYAARFVRVRLCPRQHPPEAPRLSRMDAVILIVFIATISLAVFMKTTGITELNPLGHRIGLSLHSPVLILMVLVGARLAYHFRPLLVFRRLPRPIVVVRSVVAAGVTCVLLLSPVLYVLYARLSDGGAFHGPIYWRSGPRGVDLLAFFTPNPANKLFGMPWRAWLTSQDNGYVENAAALTIVGLLLVSFAIWRYQFRPPRVWLAMAIFFGALALGPFVWVGGVNTYVLGPWALLRYVPLISAARMPARFAIVVMMAFSPVFALALAHIADHLPGRRWLVLAAVAVLLGFELAPLPRRLHAAPIPDIYQMIASDPQDVRVIDIPLGISDGERGEGRHSGASQFYQTFHQKQIVGGGLSRITDNARRRQHRFPVVRVLLRMSEGRSVSEDELAAAKRAAPDFIRKARLGYAVIDTLAATPELRAFVIELLRLQKIGESDGRELFKPSLENDTLLLQ